MDELEKLIEKRAREIDPMAWVPHAFSMTDAGLRSSLSGRREKSLQKAREELPSEHELEFLARHIAWAHWKVIYPRDVSQDELDLWSHLGDRDRDGYRAAALAVASM